MNDFTPDVRAAIRWLVTVPPLALLACAALIVVAAIVGLQPLWASPTLSLSAAAHAGDTATVYRMLERGADPNRAGEVSLSSGTIMLSPIDAAVESRQVETVQLLLNKGARVADADIPRLICLARAVEALEVDSFLRSAHHVADAIDCSRVELPAH